MPPTIPRVETIELVLEQMTYGGAALGRHEGQVIFVPYALPGERVLARIRPTRKRWAQADLIEVLDASPDRVAPPCPHFGPGKCGGCQWQHASYDAQLRYKTEIVREQLRRIGKFEDPLVRPCLGMDEPWNYRNNVQLRNTLEGPGFVSEDRRGIYPIDLCLIMNESIYPLFEAVEGQSLTGVDRLVLRGSERTGERLVIIESESGDVSLLLPDDAAIARRDRKGRVRSLKGEPAYTEELAGRRWTVSANSFFQVNSSQAEKLVEMVGTMVGPLRGDEVLLDGYAGVGLFGVSFAEQVGQVFLVESHPAAVADARQHASGSPNVTVIEAASEVAFPAWNRYGPDPDIVLLDPPRAGCEEVVLQSLGNMSVSTIIYIACDPATQARDLRRLVEYGYSLEVVQPVDMFPQTYHVESVALMSRPETSRVAGQGDIE